MCSLPKITFSYTHEPEGPKHFESKGTFYRNNFVNEPKHLIFH